MDIFPCTMEDLLPLMRDIPHNPHNLLGAMAAHLILIRAVVRREAMLKGMKVVMEGGMTTTDTGEGEVATKNITVQRESGVMRIWRGSKIDQES